ncbi:hypothetical protein BACCAP_00438 [Pseudoflavonifractor capillosus ATCC 29799]|uniref:Uncharacterized protein n=1 Tax=Pseudoflavonifractor capillosus ATCC 29799 TaxID=411467 RepID=A6NQG7_9FIRM|nr:hypothetical protein BACCAP_00438 [Pseudoflavonifractor capillosus ATCC 29799]
MGQAQFTKGHTTHNSFVKYLRRAALFSPPASWPGHRPPPPAGRQKDTPVWLSRGVCVPHITAYRPERLRTAPYLDLVYHKIQNITSGDAGAPPAPRPARANAEIQRRDFVRRRPRKLRITQPAASGRPRSLRCSSSPHERRSAFRGDPVFASLGSCGGPVRH